jgi:hypothetical protein
LFFHARLRIVSVPRVGEHDVFGRDQPHVLFEERLADTFFWGLRGDARRTAFHHQAAGDADDLIAVDRRARMARAADIRPLTAARARMNRAAWT